RDWSSDVCSSDLSLTLSEKTGPVTKIIPINVSDPKTVAAALVKALGGSTAGGPVIEEQTGGIFFRGTASQYEEAKKIVEAFEGPTALGDGKTIRFTVEGGNAGILAEALQNAM